MQSRSIASGALLLASVAFPVSLQAQCGGSFVEGFEGLSNHGNWVWSGIFHASVFEGGNPNAFIMSQGLFHPAPRFSTTDPNSQFGGNWRDRGITSTGIDWRSITVDPLAEGRRLRLVLYHHNATPGVPGDDTFVYCTAGPLPPDKTWQSYTVDVPSTSSTLPPGWSIGGPWAGSPDALWNLVIEDVERVAWVVGDPVLQPPPADFQFGADNPRVAFEGGPTTYCIAGSNSLGCSPAITWFGRPSATLAQPFAILGSQLMNGSAGMLIYSQASDIEPLFGAYRCIAPPLRRTFLGNTGGSPTGNDCSGALLTDFNAFIQSGTDPQLIPGATVFAQYWSRDSLSVEGVSLTNGLRFTICP